MRNHSISLVLKGHENYILLYANKLWEKNAITSCYSFEEDLRNAKVVEHGSFEFDTYFRRRWINVPGLNHRDAPVIANKIHARLQTFTLSIYTLNIWPTLRAKFLHVRKNQMCFLNVLQNIKIYTTNSKRTVSRIRTMKNTRVIAGDGAPNINTVVTCAYSNSSSVAAMSPPIALRGAGPQAWPACLWKSNTSHASRTHHHISSPHASIGRHFHHHYHSDV